MSKDLNDVFNEFLLSMVNENNVNLIKELRLRWRMYLGEPVIDFNKKPIFTTDDGVELSANIEANPMLAVRALIGREVNVEICCYAYGFMYPDENILVDVTETEYVFKSDEIDSEDHLWRFPISDKDCSCEVSLA